MVATRGQRSAMTTAECSIPIRRLLNSTAGEDDLRIIKVQNTRFKVNPRVLRAGSRIFKTLFQDLESTIDLSGHTASQFRAFLWAAYARPLPSAKSVDVGRLCSIAEVAFTYDFSALKLWSLEGIRTHVNSTPLLRTAPSRTFVRLIQVALLYRDTILSRAIQSKWLTRMHWHDTDPAPALVVADAYSLQHLLSHAYYVHLVNVAPRIARALPIDDGGSPLSAAQNLHVLCGYYSLLAAWKQLQVSPPACTPPDSTVCREHTRCEIAWKARWALEVGHSSAFSPVDVLCRLLFMERQLEVDEVLKDCMTPGCRVEALDAIARKRGEISENLHHHFDL
ncbi:hypothetical protein C8R45DRAFT_1207977 [Mycena sanguinolenta]|nr:hypothetical protein C8R45DRAFT_1207977 [Mycena sanguinolenta]